jgi:hypothetical protein
MSFVLTYAGLVRTMINYLERYDEIVVDSMDTWIKLSHERIGRDCGSLVFDQYITQNFTAGLPVLNKPSRIQNTLSIRFGTGTNLNYTNLILLRSYEFCRQYWPDDSLWAPPKYYSNYGFNNWLITPTPDQPYPYEIAYQETPQVIDINYQTNYLTEFMPEILIKATLIEANITLKNFEISEIFKKDYVELISSWLNKDKLTKTDRYSNRGVG